MEKETPRRTRSRSSPALRPRNSSPFNTTPLHSSVPANELYRTTKSYEEWYFSQHPRDPRLLPPLFLHDSAVPTKEDAGHSPLSNTSIPHPDAPFPLLLENLSLERGQNGSHTKDPLTSRSPPGLSLRDLRGIPTPEMLPRNLLENTTPALSPALAPTQCRSPVFRLPLPQLPSLNPPEPSPFPRKKKPQHAHKENKSHTTTTTITTPRSPLSSALPEETPTPTPPPPALYPPLPASHPAVLPTPLPSRDTPHLEGVVPPIPDNPHPTTRVPSYPPAVQQQVTQQQQRSQQQRSQQQQQQQQPLSHASESPTLRDFHTNRPRWSLPHARGFIPELSRDQEGSRWLQHALTSGVLPQGSSGGSSTLSSTPGPCDWVVREVLDDLLGLSRDVYGNYVVQRVVECGGEGVRERVRVALAPHTLALSRDTFGCRVVQHVLRYGTEPGRRELIECFRGEVRGLVVDANANHVLQKVIETTPAYVGFVVEELLPEAEKVACHSFGCRVVQRLLEQSRYVFTQSPHPFLEKLLQHTATLVRDEFGNYVLQHLLMSTTPEYRERVGKLLAAEAVALSCHKFASNVMEKFILCGNEEVVLEFAEKVCCPDENSSDKIPAMRLAMDPFGNYVIQKLLQRLPSKPRERLSTILLAHETALRDNPCCRSLLGILMRNEEKPLHKAFSHHAGRGRAHDVRRPEMTPAGRFNPRGGNTRPPRWETRASPLPAMSGYPMEPSWCPSYPYMPTATSAGGLEPPRALDAYDPVEPFEGTIPGYFPQSQMLNEGYVLQPVQPPPPPPPYFTEDRLPLNPAFLKR